jgi:hypothetical protein
MERKIHHGDNKASGIAAPSRTTSNRTAAVGAYRPIVTAHDEGAAGNKNVLKGISTIKADLKDPTIETEIRINVRCFKIEILPER